MQQNPFDDLIAPQQQPTRGVVLPPNPAEEEERRRKQAEFERNNRGESYDRTDRGADVATTLRKEFFGSKAAQDYGVALGTYNSALTTSPTAEGDQALIVNFARMLDPNSVVREGEFAIAANNEDAFTRTLTQVKRQFGVDGAGRLSDQGRSRLREEMRNLVVNRFKPPYEQARQQYGTMAQRQAVDPYLVIGEPLEAAFPRGFLDQQETEEPLVAPGSETQNVDIPQDYQDAHAAYIQQNWGRINPQEYAAFRSQFDQQYGYATPPPGHYEEGALRLNSLAERGGSPSLVNPIPPVEEEMGFASQFLNSAAQSPVGAGMAGFGDAVTAGIPLALAGQGGKMNRIREMNPGSTFIGEMGGSVAATMLGGAGLKAGSAALGASPRLAALLANPMTTEVGYGATYGATQGGAEGAAIGALGGALGQKGGQLLGKALPDSFAPGAMTQARESVPTIPQLKDKAAQQYSAVEATGAIADPAATADLLQRASNILTREGRMSPAGRLIDTDTPTNRAMTLLQDYAGQPMTPTQAGAVRNVLSEGLTGQDAAQKRITGKLLDEFDQWADPLLPGIQVPRETASRYLQGQQIDKAIKLADADAPRLTQSGRENALRGQFRNLDRSTIRGTSRFDDEVTGAIEKVARGDAISNVARGIGKFAPTSPMAMTVGGGAAGLLGNMAGGPAVGIPLGLLAAGAGTAGRNIATNRADQAATDALLTALGGPQFKALTDQAAEEAALRGGRIFGGLFGGASVAGNREYR